MVLIVQYPALGDGGRGTDPCESLIKEVVVGMDAGLVISRD